MAYARHKLRQCKQRKPNWKTKASQQHLSAQRFPPLSPSPSLSCYSCHLLYNSCQKPLDSAPRDTHSEGCNTSWPRGVCANPSSLSLPCHGLPLPFRSLADPFCEVFSSLLLLCLFAHLSPWIGAQIASSASLGSS